VQLFPHETQMVSM